jgi:hypothetical protein
MHVVQLLQTLSSLNAEHTNFSDVGGGGGLAIFKTSGI